MNSSNMEQDKNLQGVSGLTNLGNTCFINSTLQCLSHTYELNEVLSEKLPNKLNKNIESELVLNWIELKDLLWKQNCIISPKKFLTCIQKLAEVKDKEIFTGYAQNDLPEFILFILDIFHESFKREVNMNISGNIKNNNDKIAMDCYKKMKIMYSKDYSEIIKLFYGIHISEILSTDSDEQLHFISEPYFMIDLPIPSIKNPTLIDCFDQYTNIEQLDENNMWFNEKTNKKQIVKKRISFFTFPEILVIDLKRFNMSLRKNNVFVDCPLTNLDLSKYINGYNKGHFKYDLYAVCNHMGSTSGGHYTAHVKVNNQNWFVFNDTTIQRIKDDKVITQNAYCLFYRKKR